jgi:hypothetical protein
MTFVENGWLREPSQLGAIVSALQGGTNEDDGDRRAGSSDGQ